MSIRLPAGRRGRHAEDGGRRPRSIIGDIKERQQGPRHLRGKAQRTGRKAALTEQERPNIFHQLGRQYRPPAKTVAGADRISGTGAADRPANSSLRVPMVVGPAAYNPAPRRAKRRLPSPGGQMAGVRVKSQARSMRCPIATGISPPVARSRHARADEIRNQVTVHLAAGFSARRGEKPPSRGQRRKRGMPQTRIIKLAEGPGARGPRTSRADLEAGPRRGKSAVGRAVPSEHVGKCGLSASPSSRPPAVEAGHAKKKNRCPREVVFVIDNSGSMGGTSIVQAKASLLYALGRLAARTIRFNVIRFDDSMDVLFFPPSVPADRRASRPRPPLSVSALQAAGGHRDGAGDCAPRLTE